MAINCGLAASCACKSAAAGSVHLEQRVSGCVHAREPSAEVAE